MKFLPATLGLLAAVAQHPADAYAEERNTPALFNPPAGCTAFLTMQSRNCGVTHFYTCKGEPQGTTWIAYFTDEGMMALQQVSPEYQWLRGHYPRTGMTETFLPPADDPISTTELLDQGIDTYDFLMVEEQDGVRQTVRVRGWDQMTGETETIDGEVLDRTEFQVQWLDGDGNVTTEGSGQQYFSRRFMQFFSGQERYTDANGVNQQDDRPMTFAEPGEAGFLTTKPLFNCSTEQARMMRPDLPRKEPAHDL